MLLYFKTLSCEREISEFDTQFARLTKFDTQFASLSEFDTVTANSFDLGVSNLFSPISLFYIFFSISKPDEKTKLPLPYPQRNGSSPFCSLRALPGYG